MVRRFLYLLWGKSNIINFRYKLNQTSAETVLDLLKFEADFKTVQVIYNSMGNRDLNTAAKVITTRKNLCPTIGYL